jgi:hypothetical protein
MPIWYDMSFSSRGGVRLRGASNGRDPLGACRIDVEREILCRLVAGVELVGHAISLSKPVPDCILQINTPREIYLTDTMAGLYP